MYNHQKDTIYEACCIDKEHFDKTMGMFAKFLVELTFKHNKCSEKIECIENFIKNKDSKDVALCVFRILEMLNNASQIILQKVDTDIDDQVYKKVTIN